MISLGRQAGREVVCLLTDMDQPLGAAVGNALEVSEALDTVRGHGPADFTELVLDACGKLLALSDLGIDEAEGRRRAEAAVADGSAEAVWRRWIEAQGGTADESALPVAPVVREVAAPASGVRARARRDRASATPPCTSARGGAPRTTSSTTRSASSAARSGATQVEAGDVLAVVHARTEAAADEAAREVLAAYELADERAGRAAGAARGRASAEQVSDTFGVRHHRTAAVRCGVPELPEVETVRRRLAPVLEGRALRPRSRSPTRA